jgi:hypothetical protein
LAFAVLPGTTISSFAAPRLLSRTKGFCNSFTAPVDSDLRRMLILMYSRDRLYLALHPK